MTTPDAKVVLAGLLRTAGLSDLGLNEVTLTGGEPVLPSSFAIGTAAQATVAADRKSTRLNSSHTATSRMPSSA